MKKICKLLFVFIFLFSLSFLKPNGKNKENYSYDKTSFVLNNTNENEANLLAKELGCDVKLSYSKEFASFTNVKNLDAFINSHRFLENRISYNYETYFTEGEVTEDVGNYLDIINGNKTSNENAYSYKKIAIIDSGINPESPLFKDEYNNYRIDINSINASTHEKVSRDNYDAIRDTKNHGEIVASIAFRNTSFANRPLIIKVVENENTHSIPLEQIVFAIDYAIENGAEIINLSIATIADKDPYKDIINKAYQKGTTIVAASGNQGYNRKVYPASNEQVIGVGGVDSSLKLANNSNYGDNIDIVAANSVEVNGKIYSGTSFAAPQVTWALAHKSKYDDLIINMFNRGRNGIYKSANRFYNRNDKDYYYGYGLLDVDKFVYGDVHKLKYDFNTYELKNYEEYIFDDSIILNPLIPERLYYQFDGWYLDQFFDKKVDFKNFKIYNDTTIYAKWIAQDEDKFKFTYETVNNSNIKITGYKGYSKEISIPEMINGLPVTDIGDYAFASSDITKVILPKTIQNIGIESFSNTKIEKIDLPKGLKYIDNRAFSGNANLTEVNFNDNNDLYISKKAFSDCNVKKVVFPDIELYNDAFDSNMNLESISFGSKVKDLDKACFLGLTSLKNVTIDSKNPLYKSENGLLLNHTKDTIYKFYLGNNTVDLPNETRTIESEAFGYANIKSIDLKNVNLIKTNAFFKTSLENVSINKDIFLQGYAFTGNDKLKEVTFEEGVQTIYLGSFASNKSLEKVNFPSTLVCIEGKAFANCTNLTNLDLSKTSLEIIKNADKVPGVEMDPKMGAFEGCGLETVTLPDSLEKIGNLAFKNNDIKNLNIGFNSKLKIISNGAFINNNISSLYIPKNLNFNYYGDSEFGDIFLNNEINNIIVNSNNPYYLAKNYEDFATSLKSKDGKILYYYRNNKMYSNTNAFDGVEVIKRHSCNGFIYNLSLDNNSSIKTIDNNAFNNCYIYDLKIENKKIGDNAFEGSTIDYLYINNQENIPTGLFKNCHFVYDINIDDSILEIGMEAFYETTFDRTHLLNNKTISFKNALRVEREAFYGTKLNIGLGQNIEYIGDYAFSGNKFTEFIASNNLKYLGEGAFAGCNYLKKVVLNDTLTTMNSRTFIGCNVTDFTIGKNIQEIKSNAFDGIYIKTLNLPQSLKTVEPYSFSTNNIEVINFGDDSQVTYLPNDAFFGASIREIYFGKNSNLSSFNVNTFNKLVNLVTLDLENTKITSIPSYGFAYLQKLTNLKLSKDLSSIGKYAFYACTSIKTLSFSTALNYIGSFAFLQTKDLVCYFASESVSPNFAENWDYDLASYKFGVKDVIIDGDYELAKQNGDNSYVLSRYLGSEVVLDLRNCTYNLTAIMSEAFTNTPVKEIILSDGIISVYKNAFLNSNLEKITLNAKLKIIGNGAFKNSKLKEVIIPSNSELEVIDVEAFMGNTNLGSITFPASLRKINEKAFFEVNLNTIDFSKATNLIYIGDLAFAYNKNLKTLTLPNNLETIGSYAFRNNKILESINFGSGDLMLEEGAFYNSGIINLYIPTNITKIGETCFTGLPKLQNIEVSKDNLNYASLDGVLYSKNFTTIYVVPASKTGEFIISEKVEVIGTSAFENSNLSNIKLAPNSHVEVISNRAFFGAKFKSFYIPETINIIDYYAFAYNDQLETVIFDANVRLLNIREGAFYLCENLKNIKLPKDINKIGDYAFYGCKSLGDSIFANGMPFIINSHAFSYTNIKNLTISNNIIRDYAFSNCIIDNLSIVNDPYLELGQKVFENTEIKNANFKGDLDIINLINLEVSDKIEISDNPNYYAYKNAVYHIDSKNNIVELIYIPYNEKTLEFDLTATAINLMNPNNSIDFIKVNLDKFELVNTYFKNYDLYLKNSLAEFFTSSFNFSNVNKVYCLENDGNYINYDKIYFENNYDLDKLRYFDYSSLYFNGSLSELLVKIKSRDIFENKKVYYLNKQNQYLSIADLKINFDINQAIHESDDSKIFYINNLELVPYVKFDTFVISSPTDLNLHDYKFDNLICYCEGHKVNVGEIVNFIGSANVHLYCSYIENCYFNGGTISRDYSSYKAGKIYLSGNITYSSSDVKSFYLTKDLVSFTFYEESGYLIKEINIYDEFNFFFTHKISQNITNFKDKVNYYVFTNGEFELATGTITLPNNCDAYIENQIYLVNKVNFNLPTSTKSIYFGENVYYSSIDYLGTIAQYVSINKYGKNPDITSLLINGKEAYLEVVKSKDKYFDPLKYTGITINNLILQEGFEEFINNNENFFLQINNLDLPTTYIGQDTYNMKLITLHMRSNVQFNGSAETITVSDLDSLSPFKISTKNLIIKDTVLRIEDGILYRQQVKYLELPYLGRTANEDENNYVSFEHLYAVDFNTDRKFVEVINGVITYHDAFLDGYGGANNRRLTLKFNGEHIFEHSFEFMNLGKVIISDNIKTINGKICECDYLESPILTNNMLRGSYGEVTITKQNVFNNINYLGSTTTLNFLAPDLYFNNCNIKSLHTKQLNLSNPNITLNNSNIEYLDIENSNMPINIKLGGDCGFVNSHFFDVPITITGNCNRLPSGTNITIQGFDTLNYNELDSNYKVNMTIDEFLNVNINFNRYGNFYIKDLNGEYVNFNTIEKIVINSKNISEYYLDYFPNIKELTIGEKVENIDPKALEKFKAKLIVDNANINIVDAIGYENNIDSLVLTDKVTSLKSNLGYYLHCNHLTTTPSLVDFGKGFKYVKNIVSITINEKTRCEETFAGNETVIDELIIDGTFNFSIYDCEIINIYIYENSNYKVYQSIKAKNCYYTGMMNSLTFTSLIKHLIYPTTFYLKNYNELNYSLFDGTLELYDEIIEGYSNNKYLKKVILNPGVKVIKSMAFEDDRILELHLPSTLVSVESQICNHGKISKIYNNSNIAITVKKLGSNNIPFINGLELYDKNGSLVEYQYDNRFVINDFVFNQINTLYVLEDYIGTSTKVVIPSLPDNSFFSFNIYNDKITQIEIDIRNYPPRGGLKTHFPKLDTIIFTNNFNANKITLSDKLENCYFDFDILTFMSMDFTQYERANNYFILENDKYVNVLDVETIHVNGGETQNIEIFKNLKNIYINDSITYFNAYNSLTNVYLDGDPFKFFNVSDFNHPVNLYTYSGSKYIPCPFGIMDSSGKRLYNKLSDKMYFIDSKDKLNYYCLDFYNPVNLYTLENGVYTIVNELTLNSNKDRYDRYIRNILSLEELHLDNSNFMLSDLPNLRILEIRNKSYVTCYLDDSIDSVFVNSSTLNINSLGSNALINNLTSNLSTINPSVGHNKLKVNNLNADNELINNEILNYSQNITFKNNNCEYNQLFDFGSTVIESLKLIGFDKLYVKGKVNKLIIDSSIKDLYFETSPFKVYYNGLASEFINLKGARSLLDGDIYINDVLDISIKNQVSKDYTLDLNAYNNTIYYYFNAYNTVTINNPSNYKFYVYLSENNNLSLYYNGTFVDYNNLINLDTNIDKNYSYICANKTYVFENNNWKLMNKFTLTEDVDKYEYKYLKYKTSYVDSGTLTELNTSLLEGLQFDHLILNTKLKIMRIDFDIKCKTLESLNDSVAFYPSWSHSFTCDTYTGSGNAYREINVNEVYVTNTEFYYDGKDIVYHLPKNISKIFVYSGTFHLNMTFNEYIHSDLELLSRGTVIFKGNMDSIEANDITALEKALDWGTKFKEIVVNNATNFDSNNFNYNEHIVSEYTDKLILKSGSNINVNDSIKELYLNKNLSGTFINNGQVYYQGTFLEYINGNIKNNSFSKENKNFQIFYLNDDNTYIEQPTSIIVDDKYNDFSLSYFNGYPIEKLEITNKNITLTNKGIDNLLNHEIEINTLILHGQKIDLDLEVYVNTLILKDDNITCVNRNNLRPSKLYSYITNKNTDLDFNTYYLTYLEADSINKIWTEGCHIVLRNQQTNLDVNGVALLEILNGNIDTFSGKDIYCIVIHKNVKIREINFESKIAFAYNDYIIKNSYQISSIRLDQIDNPQKNIFIKDNLLWMRKNRTYYVLGFDPLNQSRDLVLPDYINGCNYYLYDYAFSDIDLYSYHLGAGLKGIGQFSFRDTYYLKEVTYSDQTSLDYVDFTSLSFDSFISDIYYDKEMNLYRIANIILGIPEREILIIPDNFIFFERYENLAKNIKYYEGPLPCDDNFWNRNFLACVDKAYITSVRDFSEKHYISSNNTAFSAKIKDFRNFVFGTNNIYLHYDPRSLLINPSAIENCKVYYDYNLVYYHDYNGDIYDVQFLRVGQVVKIPVPKKIDDPKYIYDFIGYDFDNDNLADVVPAVVHKDTHCYLLYDKTIKKHNINFIFNGKTVYVDTVDHGSNYKLKDSINVKGYDFVNYINPPSFTDPIIRDVNVEVNLSHQGPHDFSERVEVLPTCTKEGYIGLKCPICGEIKIVQILEKLPHEYEVTIVPPTCGEDGYTLHVCKHCGETYKDNFVDALKHNVDKWTTIKDATCDEDGLKEGTCSHCGKVIQEIIPAIGHNLIEISRVDATCESEGYIIYKCNHCHNEFKAIINKKMHNYIDVVLTKENFEKFISLYPNARVVKPYTIQICKNCNKVATYYDRYDEGSYLQSNESISDWIVIKNPTCKDYGYAHKVGLTSGSILDVKLIEKLDHKLIHVEGKVPTCTEDGYSEYDYCEECGEIIGKTIIPATGHDFGQWEIVTNPTVDSEGLIKRVCKTDPTHVEYYHLPKISKDDYSEGNVILKPTCTVKGQGEMIYTIDGQEFKFVIELPFAPHNYEIYEKVESTCTKEGYIIYRCSMCGNEKREVIPMLSHNYEEIKRIEPTCTKEGYIIYKCSICGNEKREVIPMLTHNYVEYKRIEPTCAEKGYIVYRCNLCGDEKREEIPLLPHNYVEYKRIEPTCTEEGYIIYKCSVCGNEMREVIPASGHNYNDISYIYDYDNLTVTGRAVCNRSPDHIIEETVNLIVTKKIGPSCENEGYIECYSEDFKNKCFVSQVRKDVLPKLGHKWSEPKFEYDFSNLIVNATTYCLNDPSHVCVEQVGLLRTIVIRPTFKNGGIIGYTTEHFNNPIFGMQYIENKVPSLAEFCYVDYVWDYDKLEVTANVYLKDSKELCYSETVTIHELLNTDSENKTIYRSDRFLLLELDPVTSEVSNSIIGEKNLPLFIGIGAGGAALLGSIIGIVLFIKKRKKI